MFDAKRFSHTESLTLEGSLNRVFPLFGPVLEKEWAAAWEPTIIAADSPLADHAGAIFLSSHAGEPDTIWYVNRFDAVNHVIEYLRITPGKWLAVLEIVCQPFDETRTCASVTYQFTALSEAGSAAMDSLRHRHPGMVRHWELAINHYLHSAENR